MSVFPVRSEILRIFWVAFNAAENGAKVEFAADANTLTATLITDSGGPYPVPTTYYLFSSTFSPEAIGFACWLTTQTQEAIFDLKSFWGDPNDYCYWTRRDIMFRDERTGEFTDIHHRFDSTIEVDLNAHDYPTLTLGDVFTTAPEEFLKRLVKDERARQKTDSNWEDFLLYCLNGITSLKSKRLTLNSDFYNYLLKEEIVISVDDHPYTGSVWDFIPLLRWKQKWKQSVEAAWHKRWTEDPNDIPF